MDIRRDLMGWGDPQASTQDKLDIERRGFEQHLATMPIVFNARPARQLNAPMLEAWRAFQVKKGFGPESSCLWLMPEFIFGKPFVWYPQDGGTCVWSNTFREIVDRGCCEIALNGDLEWMGSQEDGVLSIAPHCVTYGFAREDAGMRSGDGLYASPMMRALTMIGMIMCNDPELKKLMDAAGATSDSDYPEPRNLKLYRQIGNWAWNAKLKPRATQRLLECPKPRNAQDIMDFMAAYKTGFVCSSIAIKKKGKHKDGFDIHTEDRRDRWDHNMGLAGFINASDNDRFISWSNRSWCQHTGDPYEYIYNVAATEVDQMCAAGRVDMYMIGDIDRPKIPQIAA